METKTKNCIMTNFVTCAESFYTLDVTSQTMWHYEVTLQTIQHNLKPSMQHWDVSSQTMQNRVMSTS